MRSRVLAILAVGCLLSATASADTPAQDFTPCPASRAPSLVLPHVAEAVATNTEVTIVAFGSSSTQGWHASDIAHSYPRILQSALDAALPEAHVAVLNRGIGGQDATEMMSRLETDVLAIRPTAVIWQVGANAAMKHLHPETFRQLVAAGVKRLREANIDVVLMDNQRAPAILASPQHVLFDEALADVALGAGAGLFSRGALMEEWRDGGYPYERFIADDGVHHNDYGYRCIAQALASSIMEGLGKKIPDRAFSARR